MPVADHLSRSRVAFEEARTLVAVIDMSLSSWVVLGLVPGLERRPEKKLGADEAGLLSLVHRWRDEAERRGCRIERICVAFEAGRDGFWLARWLEGHGIEPHVIHASSPRLRRIRASAFFRLPGWMTASIDGPGPVAGHSRAARAMQASVAWPRGASGFTLRRRPQGQFQLDLLPPGPHERTVLTALTTVRAFVGKPTTIPSADFRAAITALAGPFSPESARRGADHPR